MKHREEIMQILEAFDLTQSYRDAGELAYCSPNTVAHWVARRDAGELTATAVHRPQLIDEFLPKLEEWMKASNGRSVPTSPTTSWWRTPLTELFTTGPGLLPAGAQGDWFPIRAYALLPIDRTAAGGAG